MDSERKLEHSLVGITLKLYNKPVIPRNVIQFVIDLIYDLLFKDYFSYFEETMNLLPEIFDEKVKKSLRQYLKTLKQYLTN